MTEFKDAIDSMQRVKRRRALPRNCTYAITEAGKIACEENSYSDKGVEMRVLLVLDDSPSPITIYEVQKALHFGFEEHVVRRAIDKLITKGRVVPAVGSQ